MAKKFMIRCDMEGVSGIVSYEQAETGKPEYELGRKWFMSDLNALILGLKDGGADEIHIYDEHCEGRNILIEELPDVEGLYLYLGKPVYTPDNVGGLDDSFDGLILLGFHSKRGSVGCLLQHTYEPDIKDILVDGFSVGEIGSESLLAFDFGVPLVMITGDSKGIEEAKYFGKDACEYVTVKESVTEFGAICYSLKKTAKMIYDSAKVVAGKTHQRVDKLISKKVNVEVKFFDTPFAKKYLEKFGEPIFSDKPYSVAWSEYQINKHAVWQALKEGE